MSLTFPMQQAPTLPTSGPFFVLQSACEDSPEDRPFYVVIRRPRDILFPTGLVPRRWSSWRQAQQSAEYCNQLVKRIAILLQRREQGGFLLEQSIDGQLEDHLQTITSLCFSS